MPRIIMKGPVIVTNLRNGLVRVESAKAERPRKELPRTPFENLRGRPRLHIRTDEFMRLINSVPSRFGAL